ncbi:hypothetical protein EYF80_009627 [Liparis tanakae]|uniref:Uncharacterized protein n=1 Tax=Liparis tanakae TaxID=230148 RepID=A0A4Z2IQH3_9TELE|nr:hypothetical protein EYF80_009627 [Liparis tanakae]
MVKRRSAVRLSLRRNGIRRAELHLNASPLRSAPRTQTDIPQSLSTQPNQTKHSQPFSIYTYHSLIGLDLEMPRAQSNHSSPPDLPLAIMSDEITGSSCKAVLLQRLGMKADERDRGGVRGERAWKESRDIHDAIGINVKCDLNLGNTTGSRRDARQLKLAQQKSWSSFWILGIRVEPPTNTMSWIWALSIFASRRDFSTGSKVPRKRSALSSSKRALVIEV